MTEIAELIAQHQQVIAELPALIPQIEAIAAKMQQAINNSGTIFWMGNGGSAADAQHLAAELVGRFQRERVAIPSIALTTDSSILTSLANDYDYAKIFARQIEALVKAEDIVVGITTSGNSANVIAGIEAAKRKQAVTVGFLGSTGGMLKDMVDLSLIIPSAVTARIQEAHILMGHILCQLIEDSVAE